MNRLLNKIIDQIHFTALVIYLLITKLNIRSKPRTVKKVYTTPEYKLKHKRKYFKSIKILRQKKANPRGSGQSKSSTSIADTIKPTVSAPNDFRLIENTEICLSFFRDLRSTDFLNEIGNRRFVSMSLKYVTKIDYGTISILTALSDDLKFKGINVRGDFPDNLDCKKFMLESGYLNHLFNDQGQKFSKAPKSDLIFFEKGFGVLSAEDNKKISETVKNVVNHLTGQMEYCLPVKTIILEICGNSIEWSGTDNKQWLLGVKYADNKVVFTVTDVGKGILDTLYKKVTLKLKDFFENTSDDKILAGAFAQKYGSSTQEVNRNKGLLSVKANSDKGVIQKLKVLTNNVILHFDDNSLSKTLKKGSPRFKGTFYQWEMTKDCLDIISKI